MAELTVARPSKFAPVPDLGRAEPTPPRRRLGEPTQMRPDVSVLGEDHEGEDETDMPNARIVLLGG
jgi:hypothetical protein